jgi:hypothetical protein
MIHVDYSTIIPAPLSSIWSIVADFNGLPNWHPAATESYIETGKQNGEIGCIRNFALSDGSGRVRETLLAISQTDHSLTYDMLDAPLPFIDYVATMSFLPVTETNHTFARWVADFKAGDGRDDHWQAFVCDDVFAGGFKALEKAVTS